MKSSLHQLRCSYSKLLLIDRVGGSRRVRWVIDSWFGVKCVCVSCRRCESRRTWCTYIREDTVPDWALTARRGLLVTDTEPPRLTTSPTMERSARRGLLVPDEGPPRSTTSPTMERSAIRGLLVSDEGPPRSTTSPTMERSQPRQSSPSHHSSATLPPPSTTFRLLEGGLILTIDHVINRLKI